MILPLLMMLAQTPAPTPAPTPAGPPPAFMAAAQALNTCLGQGLAAVPAGTAPADGAQRVIAGCAPQRAALDAQFDTLIAGPAVPAASRDSARAQYKAQMDQIPTQIAAALQQRAAPAPAPTPTPTPSGRPTSGGR